MVATIFQILEEKKMQRSQDCRQTAFFCLFFHRHLVGNILVSISSEMFLPKDCMPGKLMCTHFMVFSLSSYLSASRKSIYCTLFRVGNEPNGHTRKKNKQNL